MEPEGLLPHSQVLIRDIQARTGSFLAKKPNVTVSQKTDGEGAAGFLDFFSNSSTGDIGDAAKPSAPTEKKNIRPYSCTHEEPGMEKQSHIETPRNSQPENDQSKEINEGGDRRNHQRFH
jgi:hypothetical protein